MIIGAYGATERAEKLGPDSDLRKRPVLSSTLTDLICPLQAKFTVLEPLCIAPRRQCERVLTRSVEETRSNSDPDF